MKHMPHQVKRTQEEGRQHTVLAGNVVDYIVKYKMALSETEPGSRFFRPKTGQLDKELLARMRCAGGNCCCSLFSMKAIEELRVNNITASEQQGS